MARVNRQWLLKTRPVGMVSEANFEWREAPLPAVLVRVLASLGLDEEG